MKSKKHDGGYLLKLEIGEELIASLVAFARERKIKSGWVHGIGAVDDTVLGVYDLKRKRYDKRAFKGDHELVGLTGNLSWLGKDPVAHVHAVISDSKLRTYGGHLFQARCCVTVEIALLPWNIRLTRQADKRTGLNLLRV